MAQYPIKLSQETVEKHLIPFDKKIDINSDYWITKAQENHRQRGSFSIASNLNTSLVLSSSTWQSLLAGTYFHPRPQPPASGAQLSLDIESGDIMRSITTRKVARDYNVESDVMSPAQNETFLFTFTGSSWDIVHRES